LGLSVPAAWKGAVRPSSVKTAPQESNGTGGHLRFLKIGTLHQSAWLLKIGVSDDVAPNFGSAIALTMVGDGFFNSTEVCRDLTLGGRGGRQLPGSVVQKTVVFRAVMCGLFRWPMPSLNVKILGHFSMV
jgi:hypothetical protein